MNLAEAQQWTDEFLDERLAPPRAVLLESLSIAGPGSGFSPFLPEDAERAREASRELMLAADAAGGGAAGLDAARERAQELLREQDQALVRFALKLFVTHHPDGRRLQITPLERRAPLKVLPSELPSALPRPGLESSGAEEAVLNWWREDPEANEHHDHWHAVYPTVGIAEPRPGDPRHSRLQDRQGELFFYMHQQMLARYDHERIAVGLPRVEPLADYDAPIPEGYDAAQGLQGFPPELFTDGVQPRARPDGAHMIDPLPVGEGQTLPRARLDVWYARLLEGARRAKLLNSSGEEFDAGVDELGHATEPSRARGQQADSSRIPDPARYGGFHGLGHVFISLAAGDPAGVMADTDTAIRDPVFYRWHRHIDDLGYEWQQRQEPHDLSQHAAQVRLRHGAAAGAGRPGESMDLILIVEADLPAGLDDAGFVSHVQAAVGDAHWDEDFSAATPGTDELQTEMLSRRLEIQPPIQGAPEVDIPYLDQRPFAYALRMENARAEDHDVTVRLFFVADALFEERRMWIELDKFRHPVAGERSVAVRRARDSAVIRKPALKPPGPTRHSPLREPGVPGAFDEESYCECGWPYNLLLPRGTGAGMHFWLAAMVTDGEGDQVSGSNCGSMSFCGARDRYPDRRPMGYPFDRPITGGELAAALSEMDHMAARSFRIRWLNPG